MRYSNVSSVELIRFRVLRNTNEKATLFYFVSIYIYIENPI